MSKGNESVQSVEGALHQFDWQLQMRTPCNVFYYNIDQYNCQDDPLIEVNHSETKHTINNYNNNNSQTCCDYE